MQNLKYFKDYINEEVENGEEYKEQFFDEVQEYMKSILQEEKGEKNYEKITTDIITQHQNTIKEMIDNFMKDGTITPDIIAKQVIDKYYKRTKFNNKGCKPDTGKLTGDRAMNSMK